MVSHSSDSTSPADHLIRTTEMEAVVMDLRNKIKDIETPGGPDLTAVNAAIDRLYKIVLYGAAADGTGAWGSTPREDMIFDDASKQRSFFTTVFGVDGYGLSWAQFLTQTTNSSVMRLTYGNDTNIAAWLDTNGKDLTTVTIGSTDILDALGGKSLAEKAIGTPAMINAIGARTALEMVFGNATRAAIWSTSIRSLAEGVYGDARPNVAQDPIITRIARIEARLSAGGL